MEKLLCSSCGKFVYKLNKTLYDSICDVCLEVRISLEKQQTIEEEDEPF